MIAPGWMPAEAGKSLRLMWLDSQADPIIAGPARELALKLDPSLDSTSIASLETANQAGLTIIAHETYEAFGHLIATGKVDSGVAARLQRAATINADQLEDAEHVRTVFSRDLNRTLKTCDAIALPTLADFPPKVADAGNLQAMINITRLCRPFNLSGHPAISIPVTTIDSRPVSLQLVAAKGNDEFLVALARRALNICKSDPYFQED